MMGLLAAVWELPQSSLGAILFGAARAAGLVKHVERIDGRFIIEAPPLGVSLGWFVFYNVDGSRYFPPDPLMKKHEIGHTVQSRALGPLYLPVVGMASMTRALYAFVHREVTGRPWPGYFNGFPERQADRLGGISAAERDAWIRASTPG